MLTDTQLRSNVETLWDKLWSGVLNVNKYLPFYAKGGHWEVVR